MSLGVLFVCTGNICRSPVAAALFEHHLGARSRDTVRVTSAGTRGLVGRPIDQVAAAALREVGVDARAHRAARIDAGMVAGADLILTATTEHRRIVLQDDPGAFRRTFTMREFVRLSAGLGPLRPGPSGNRVVRRIADAASQRGLRIANQPGGDDIGDPFGAPMPVMQDCVRRIDDTVRATLSALGLD